MHIKIGQMILYSNDILTIEYIKRNGCIWFKSSRLSKSIYYTRDFINLCLELGTMKIVSNNSMKGIYYVL